MVLFQPCFYFLLESNALRLTTSSPGRHYRRIGSPAGCCRRVYLSQGANRGENRCWPHPDDYWRFGADPFRKPGFACGKSAAGQCHGAGRNDVCRGQHVAGQATKPSIQPLDPDLPANRCRVDLFSSGAVRCLAGALVRLGSQAGGHSCFPGWFCHTGGFRALQLGYEPDAGCKCIGFYQSCAGFCSGDRLANVRGNPFRSTVFLPRCWSSEACGGAKRKHNPMS